ncbi:hypothetical protein LCGC14_1424950 [marine sediment metagenome]|uniref:Uncharacterized protein n=1 Tax=marine sediment metagenome TaxID=412755 RepID=A0A0F9M5R0_9ZZZZ
MGRKPPLRKVPTKESVEVVENKPGLAPKIGSCVVMHNGMLDFLEMEDPHTFHEKKFAVVHAEQQAREFPGLSFCVYEAVEIIGAKVIMEYIRK